VKVVCKIRKAKQERSKRHFRMLKKLEEFGGLPEEYLSETEEIKCNPVFLSMCLYQVFIQNGVSLKILHKAVKKDCRGKPLNVV